MLNSELSYTEENYLKAVFRLSKEGHASTNSIAEHLNTKASSITDMLKKLKQKKLVNYEKYQGASLTANGKKIALHIIRKHRLWEVFLVNKLGFKWDEVHDIAEQLEHIKSPELVNRLDDFLNNPEIDPHGDLIPDKNGNFPSLNHILLSQSTIGSKVTISGVKDSSSEFLKFLDKYEISLGQKIVIEDINTFDNSMSIKKGSQTLILSEKTCKNIYVKK